METRYALSSRVDQFNLHLGVGGVNPSFERASSLTVTRHVGSLERRKQKPNVNQGKRDIITRSPATTRKKEDRYWGQREYPEGIALATRRNLVRVRGTVTRREELRREKDTCITNTRDHADDSRS